MYPDLGDERWCMFDETVQQVCDSHGGISQRSSLALNGVDHRLRRSLEESEEELIR
jgi:hypothetical protein